MNTGLLPWLMSFVSLTLLVWVGLLGLTRAVGQASRLTLKSRSAVSKTEENLAGDRRDACPTRRLGLGLLAVAISVVPVGGFPLARIVAGFGWVPSVPLLVLLADAVLRGVRGADWLRLPERRAMWLWGALAGLALYPSALGLGRFDAYSLGWGFSPLVVVVAAMSVGLLWRGHRFGLVLVLAAAIWQAGGFESANYWDYLVDPVYFAISVLALARSYAAARGATASRKRQTGAQPQGS